MYAVNWGDVGKPAKAESSPLTEELAAILALRDRAVGGRDLLYCSPVVRHLVEEELPRLVALAGANRK